jgi:hypothetical protein
MKKHKHQLGDSCICYTGALIPNINCPLHGYPYLNKCETCGQFFKIKNELKVSKNNTIEYKRYKSE